MQFQRGCRRREIRQDNWECDYGDFTNVSLEAMHCGLYSNLYVNARIDITQRVDLRNHTCLCKQPKIAEKEPIRENSLPVMFGFDESECAVLSLENGILPR